MHNYLSLFRMGIKHKNTHRYKELLRQKQQKKYGPKNGKGHE